LDTQKTIFVLCHSVLHKAFRPIVRGELTQQNFNSCESSKFVINTIIEQQAELSENDYFAVTSGKVWESFKEKFLEDKPSKKRAQEVLDIFKNSIKVAGDKHLKTASLDDSVFIICDILYNLNNYTPILISNIPSKLNKAEKFYNKKSSNTIPFKILNTTEAKEYLIKNCKL
jgi:hypothetical protein